MARVKPVSPGELLREEFLIPMGLSQYRLAREIGVPAQRIGDIVAGKRAVTADTDLRLCGYRGRRIDGARGSKRTSGRLPALATSRRRTMRLDRRKASACLARPNQRATEARAVRSHGSLRGATRTPSHPPLRTSSIRWNRPGRSAHTR